jgi:hypothetical protein
LTLGSSAGGADTIIVATGNNFYADSTITARRVPISNNLDSATLLVNPAAAAASAPLTTWKVGGVYRAWVSDVGRFMIRNLNAGNRSKTAAGVSYNYLSNQGALAPSNAAISNEEDLFVDGDVEIDGGLYLDGSLTVASTGLVTNLNADFVDGLQAGELLRSNTSDAFTSGVLSTSAGTTLDVNGTLRIDSPNGSVLRNGTQVDFCGTATSESGANVNLGAGWTNIGTVQITPPANGFVLVTAGGAVAANPAAGQTIGWSVGLYSNATTVYTYSQRQTNMTVSVGGFIRFPFQTTWRFSVSGGTTYTFYLNGNGNTNGAPYVDHHRMEAIYIPRNY